jgi:hypothetical protein
MSREESAQCSCERRAATRAAEAFSLLEGNFLSYQPALVVGNVDADGRETCTHPLISVNSDGAGKVKNNAPSYTHLGVWCKLKKEARH